MTVREAYRLARAVPDGRGGSVLDPLDGLPFFDSWKDAERTARELSRKGGGKVVCTAVLVDARGRVVFPPESTVSRSRGRWHVAPVIQLGPRSEKPTRNTRSKRLPDDSP